MHDRDTDTALHVVRRTCSKSLVPSQRTHPAPLLYPATAVFAVAQELNAIRILGKEPAGQAKDDVPPQQQQAQGSTLTTSPLRKF